MASRRFDESMILEVLRGAHERLRQGWTTGHMARTGQLDPVPPEHPEAARWCTFGAIRAACLERFPTQRPTALLLAETSAKYLGAMLQHLGHEVLPQSAPRTLMEWNDVPNRSQREVLQVYQDTISILERRSP